MEVTTIELTGYDPDILAEATAYFARSDSVFTSKATDTPANRAFIPRAVNAGTFDLFMYSNNKTGGKGSEAGGAIVLDNSDGGLDYLRKWGVDGRKLAIRRGDADNDNYPADFATLLQGTQLAPTFTLNTVNLRVRSRLAEVVNQTLQSLTYAGNNVLPNGVEGVPTDLAGKYKPILWGSAPQMPVPQVNTSKRTFQISAFEILSIEGVYDRGAWVDPGLEYASLAALQAATVPSGFYDYYLGGDGDGAFFRLGTDPTGTVTCDATAPLNTMADIVQDMLVSFAGVSGAELDGVAALNTANSSEVYYWAGVEPVKVGDAIFEILDGGGAWLTEKRDGTFLMGRLEAPSGLPKITITEDYAGDNPLNVEILNNGDAFRQVPSRNTRVGYAKIYQTQTGGEIAGFATNAFVEFVRDEYRFKQDNLATVMDKHLTAETVTVLSLFKTEAAALAEANRLQALWGVDRELINIPVPSSLAANVEINDVVKLVLNRYDWDDGKLFRVTGISLDNNTNITVLQGLG